MKLLGFCLSYEKRREILLGPLSWSFVSFTRYFSHSSYNDYNLLIFIPKIAIDRNISIRK